MYQKIFRNTASVIWYLTLVLSKRSLAERERFVMLRRGPTLKIRLSTIHDIGSILECFKRKAYFPCFLQIPKNPVILDIGASIGDFSVLSALKFKNATVFSFEPAQDAFKLLKENILINGFVNRIKPYQFGVTSTTKPLEIEGRFHTTVTIDQIFQKTGIERIDLLKMDIEGYEYEIFSKIGRDTLDRISAITMECHVLQRGERLRELVNCLQRAGFLVKTTRINAYKTAYLYAMRS